MEPVFPSAALAPGACRVVKRAGQQVVVFRLDDGRLAAVDNRCPHEGYPLSQGSCVGTTLTCCYHNYKFDLLSGACLKGDEAVRAVPVDEVDGQVRLDLSPPDPGPTLDRARESFARALFDGRVGQALRDAARRVQLGDAPARLLAELAADDGARSEWGSTHVLAVAADLLRLEGAVPVVEALALPVEMVCESHVRRPARARAAPIPSRSLAAELAEAVEAEDMERAEGLVRGALAVGSGRAELEHALLGPVCEHFLDFGHAAIYQARVFDLLDAAGWDHAPDVLAGFVVGMVNATREDTLPGWRRFREQLAAAAPRFTTWQRGRGEPDPTGIEELGGRELVDRVVELLDGGAAPEGVGRALVGAASERVLRFDVTIDADRAVQDDWLSVTHCLTFAEAVHTLLVRSDDPRALRLLLMAARMVGHHRVLDGRRPAWDARPWDPAAFAAAVAARREEAMGFVESGLAHAPEALRALALDAALGERFTRPIVVAHGLKLVVAAFAAWERSADPRPVLAAVRLLVSPVVERRARRLAVEATALVERGEVPKLLAP